MAKHLAYIATTIYNSFSSTSSSSSSGFSMKLVHERSTEAAQNVFVTIARGIPNDGVVAINGARERILGLAEEVAKHKKRHAGG
jgi:hypothetical protein